MSILTAIFLAAVPQETVDPTELECVPFVFDHATASICIGASSEPVWGLLYPLSSDFTVFHNGNVGIGTTFPNAPLEVVGDVLAGGDATTPSNMASLQQVRPAFGSSTNPTLRFSAGVEETGLSSPAQDTIAMISSAQERMLLAADGRIGIGVAPTINRGFVVSDSGVFGTAIYGEAPGTGITNGVVGATTAPGAPGIDCLGDMGASGSKSFVQPHPSDSTKELRFYCLEGNESGTYCRGSGRISSGRAVLEVPETFRLVSRAEGLTVLLTPSGGRADLWVESVDLDRIVVRGSADVAFHYRLHGVRRGFEDVELIRTNLAFVPELRATEFGTQYPEGLREILIENGTLDARYQPNEATAHRNGWELRDAGDAASATRR